MGLLFLIVLVVIFAIIIAILYYKNEEEYKALESSALKKAELPSCESIPHIDDYISVRSSQAAHNYDVNKYFKEDKNRLAIAKEKLIAKQKSATKLKQILKRNEYKSHPQYDRLKKQFDEAIANSHQYIVCVKYVSPSGNSTVTIEIYIYQDDIDQFEQDPSLLMTKTEYNRFLKEQEKEALTRKQHEFYDRINRIIDLANESRKSLIIKGSLEQLDNLITQLFDRVVSGIKKIKASDSEEWTIIENLFIHIDKEINEIISRNQKIIKYYESEEFAKIKETCDVLMSSQIEFNEYITEKVESIAKLFGTRVIRNETVHEDEYQYIRPYQKTITPFTAEVSASVFASAENNPLDYVVKNFYSNKELYPEQILKLHLLLDELATLKEAKEIIENHKKEYQQYIVNVPKYVLEEDEAGFYSKLGFANIDESALIVEYKFSYTSGGGMAKRTFTIPMTEETIVELIKALERKLTLSAFTKKQRILMTNKLREFIKTRDNYTCCNCKNSIYKEPNLLLEVDHIIPVSKGGYTEENNLQTLCWKCNRAKSNKIVNQ